MSPSYAPTFICPEQNPPLTGPKRVALHSMFRLICAANQLVVNDVAYESSQHAPVWVRSKARDAV